jgi:hypothetical protein
MLAPPARLAAECNATRSSDETGRGGLPAVAAGLVAVAQTVGTINFISILAILHSDISSLSPFFARDVGTTNRSLTHADRR